MRHVIRCLTLGVSAALVLTTPPPAVGAPGPDPVAETTLGAEAQLAQACLDHLKAFDAMMEKDGYWLGGSSSGYGYPLGGYWAGSVGSDAGMAMGAASAMLRYANVRPGYEVRVLLGGADILARHGKQEVCEDVLVQVRASYDAYKADTQGRDLRVANALGFRTQELSLAKPVVSRTTAFRLDDLLGSEVRTPGNVALGSVDDIVMGLEGGRIAYLVVARGGVLGLGQHHVAVPWDRFKITPNLNILVLDTTRDGMDRAPQIIGGRFTKAESLAQQAEKADAYWNSAAKIPRTD
ncbi:PRC-barrel domain-containing protein [Methylobacterium sp. J-076]|uniref:PRC-barrel domain-containing protein n=1 Tax=Methylobacterium sp. J-076 TaxID=2836655 RepID=UPI001FB8CBA1|nr:PRC-barrel domain-containing protein [Methylobacterium sp. J-076]MCJ2015601.1 PRC-barrel domain-containing protein [Methylobacterium sp. J-076]